MEGFDGLLAGDRGGLGEGVDGLADGAEEGLG